MATIKICIMDEKGYILEEETFKSNAGEQDWEMARRVIDRIEDKWEKEESE